MVGALLQVNADAILGEEGWSAKRWCAGLLENFLVDFVGSDAHNLTNRR